MNNHIPCSEQQLSLQFDMVAELAFTMRETVERDIEEDNEKEIDDNDNENEENENEQHNEENKDNDEYDKKQEEMQTLNIHKMEK
eukprot:2908808-Amphidinium_carterae.1